MKYVQFPSIVMKGQWLKAAGFDTGTRVDVRVIAASNQNLQERAAFRTPKEAPALHDFQDFSLLMGFQRVWDFDRRQAERDEPR